VPPGACRSSTAQDGATLHRLRDGSVDSARVQCYKCSGAARATPHFAPIRLDGLPTSCVACVARTTTPSLQPSDSSGVQLGSVPSRTVGTRSRAPAGDAYVDSWWRHQAQAVCSTWPAALRGRSHLSSRESPPTCAAFVPCHESGTRCTSHPHHAVAAIVLGCPPRPSSGFSVCGLPSRPANAASCPSAVDAGGEAATGIHDASWRHPGIQRTRRAHAPVAGSGFKPRCTTSLAAVPALPLPADLGRETARAHFPAQIAPPPRSDGSQLFAARY